MFLLFFCLKNTIFAPQKHYHAYEKKVATHEGWEADPTLVTNFYNMLRKKCWGVKPNEGHRLVAKLEEKYNVTVVTQNVDNLHEMAGSSKVIHLHGELMKVCSSRDVDDPRYQIQLTPENCEVEPGTKAGDGSLLRPFIVFFGEAVPNISVAAEEVQEADILVIIGTSLVVYGDHRYLVGGLSRRRSDALCPS